MSFNPFGTHAPGKDKWDGFFEAEAEATEPRALTPWNRDIPQLQHQRILPSDRPTASILA